MSQFAKLDGVLRKLALTLAILTCAAVPAGFGVADYNGRMNLLAYTGESAANRVAKYVYVSGETWHYSRERLAELITSSFHDAEWCVLSIEDGKGQVLVALGAAIGKPVMTARVPIVVSAETIGYVVVTTSARPFLADMLWFLLAGIALGVLVYGCVHYFPSRALRRVVRELVDTQDDLREQIERTSKALAFAEIEQQRAEQASRAKSQFLANMSHELRTPLNAIIGFSDLMTSGLHGPLHGQYADYIRHINQSGQGLLRIINDILDIAKIDAGQLQTEIEGLDAARLVEQCVELSGPQAAAAKLRLYYQKPVRMDCSVAADSRRLRQSILHLLSNAIKFTPPEGRVSVMMARCEAGMIDIVIEDTGIGMTQAQIAEACQPFLQVDGSLARKYEGTGLGLALAKRLTELQGGKLMLDSACGAGTKAVLRLPAATAVLPQSLPAKRRVFIARQKDAPAVRQA